MTNQADYPANRPGRLFASPRARRAIAKSGIDPALLRGSGPGGRIVEADVLNFAAQPARISAGATSSLEVSALRLAVARRTRESFATVPHFYLRAEMDAAALLDLRQQLLQQVEKDFDVRLTLSDLILWGMALALRNCPHVNRIWCDDQLAQLSSVDIGIVVSVDDGLLIPVIRRADTLGLTGVARRRAELVHAARAGRLPADANQPCATSLSNMGASRVDEFAAIIAPPQSTILAVGRVAPRPYVVDGELCVRPTLRLTLSVDHRVMDGRPAAEFLGRIVQLLERPVLL